MGCSDSTWVIGGCWRSMGVTAGATYVAVLILDLFFHRMTVPGGGGPKIGADAAFDAVLEVKLFVGGVLNVFAGQTYRRAGHHGLDHERRHQDQEFLFGALVGGVAEKGAEVGQIA